MYLTPPLAGGAPAGGGVRRAAQASIADMEAPFVPEIGRPAVGDEDPTTIPTAMEPGLTCDLRIGPSVVLWVGVGVLGLVALLLCLFFCVVLKMKRTEKSKNLKVHP